MVVTIPKLHNEEILILFMTNFAISEQDRWEELTTYMCSQWGEEAGLYQINDDCKLRKSCHPIVTAIWMLK